MTKEKLETLLKEAQYTFAKTMPKNPHFYTLRTTWNDQDFIDVVKYIRKYGEKQRYYKKIYIYYYLDGYKYWTMGDPINETILINKAKVNENIS